MASRDTRPTETRAPIKGKMSIWYRRATWRRRFGNRQRHRDPDRDVRSKTAQEDEHHQHHQHDGGADRNCMSRIARPDHEGCGRSAHGSARPGATQLWSSGTAHKCGRGPITFGVTCLVTLMRMARLAVATRRSGCCACSARRRDRAPPRHRAVSATVFTRFAFFRRVAICAWSRWSRHAFVAKVPTDLAAWR